MIDYIPVSIHGAILICLVLFAAYRGGPFPLRLTSLYAFFYGLQSLVIYLLSNDKLEVNPSDWFLVVLLGILFNGSLAAYAYKGPRVKWSGYFTILMVLAIITITFKYFCIISFEGVNKEIALESIYAVEWGLAVLDILVLVQVINGSGNKGIIGALNRFFGRMLASGKYFIGIISQHQGQKRPARISLRQKAE